MQRYFTIQPDMLPDMSLPYPYFVREDGRVDRQDFWRGKIYRVIGFQADINAMRVDLFWSDFLKDPQRAVGMHAVTADDKNKWGTDRATVGSVRVENLDESYVVENGDVAGRSDTLDGAKAEFKRLGGRLSDGYSIQFFLGDFAPEIKTVNPRKSRA